MLVGSTTHWRWGFVIQLLFLVLGWLGADSLDVMMEKRQVVWLHHNATIFCKISYSSHLDITTMGVIWFWKGQESSEEVKLLEVIGDHQNTRRLGATVPLSSLAMGDASLQLPGVTLKEAGRYRCKVVVTPNKAEDWVWLEVGAKPAGILLPETAMMKIYEEKTLVCVICGFYPESINITWKKWTKKDSQFTEISGSNTIGPAIPNKDGTFNITSVLKLALTLEDNGNIYQCVISHQYLPTPLEFNFTLTVSKAAKNSFGFAGAYVMLLFTSVFIFL